MKIDYLLLYIMIKIEAFRQSILTASIPEGLPLHLQALWYDGRSDWKKAHDLIDQLSDHNAARVHAYLHRKEGDIWNADYWYRRAGSKRPDCTLNEEWEALVRSFSQ
jgi:hypothetical protein